MISWTLRSVINIWRLSYSLNFWQMLAGRHPMLSNHNLNWVEMYRKYGWKRNSWNHSVDLLHVSKVIIAFPRCLEKWKFCFQSHSINFNWIFYDLSESFRNFDIISNDSLWFLLDSFPIWPHKQLDKKEQWRNWNRKILLRAEKRKTSWMLKGKVLTSPNTKHFSIFSHHYFEDISWFFSIYIYITSTPWTLPFPFNIKNIFHILFHFGNSTISLLINKKFSSKFWANHVHTQTT